ncbi:MAG: hypothetical protein A2W36_07140 [Chloroflexi bacterium RBG_16_58_14]|nr:MAG: hypothetical protein A2W36_07140 [Chloroflexi bacterium RBG_16_58_14]
MPIDWDETQKALSPVKDYQSLLQRLQESFAYLFVRQNFNLSLPELENYTRLMLGGDSRGRYAEYLALLVGALSQLQQAGVSDILDLLSRTATPNKLQGFVEQSDVHAPQVVAVLKFLLYWVVPGEKYLSGLVRDDPSTSQAIKVLGGLGVRTNLQLLQQGLSAAGRKALSGSSGLPGTVIAELVNRADFSRLPWASKATISNIIGAGYGSLAKLANADPEKLYADFFRYGKAIGKNLKLGNEIENSYRIAKIVPAVLQAD